MSQQFHSGARRQDGLDNNTAYLWNRSPADASGIPLILSTANLDNLIQRTALNFSNITDIKAPLRSSDLIIHYSHVNESAPKFFKWAGLRVPWKDNSDFRALFVYSELDAGILYVDSLFENGFVVEDPTNFIAWREAVCTGNTRGDRSCTSASALVAAPVLPLYISVDNAKTPENIDPRATEAHFCPLFNADYYLDSDPVCQGRATDWKQDWHDGLTRRQISFYKDHIYPSMNLVDDGDTALHELAHAVQTALNPGIMESSVATSYHMDAIIEGSADFFAAAARRDDEVFRYANTQVHEIFPTLSIGDFAATSRDPKNSLYFPNAYSYRSEYEIGRVLSGAMNDYRKVLQGESVSKLLNAADIGGLGSPVESDVAWDMSLGVLLQAFYKINPSELTMTLNRFAALMVETCVGMGSTKCKQAELKSILENRGILSKRYFTHSRYLTSDVDEQTYDAASAVGTANSFLFVLGKSNVTGDDAQLRWGLNMGETLGWAPFLPGGSTEFANNDGYLNPCEAVVVFPNITNNTSLEQWKAARTRTNADFPLIPDFLSSFDLIPVAQRGIDFIDFAWSLAAAPSGFENFEHPTLGYIDPYSGVNANDIRGIPFLGPTEDVQTLVRDQSSRLYEIQQEKAHDLPWASKTASSAADASTLRSRSGWIFQVPEDPADPLDPDEKSAVMTFKINYSAYNMKNTIRPTNVAMFTRVGVAAPVLQAYDSVSQSLRVSSVDAGFCD